MENLRKDIAKRIIETLGSYGVPPPYGLKYFTVGIDSYLNVIEKEYLESLVKDIGASFKLVVGIYGGGKTHFLYCVRNLAWKHNYATAYVELSSNECPFYKLELVYRGIIKNIEPPLDEDDLLNNQYYKGIKAFTKNWIGYKYRSFKGNNLDTSQINQYILDEIMSWDDVESISFKKAMQHLAKKILYKDNNDIDYIEQWLVEGKYYANIHRNFGILEKPDKSTAFPYIRSLIKIVKLMGYSGLIILFDEAEQVPSLSTREKEQVLTNLREIIDECTSSLHNVMFFYAIPQKEILISGRSQIYTALRQRLETVFQEINPSGVEINLENISMDPHKFLKEIGEKLMMIYNIAYDIVLPERITLETIEEFADKVYEERYADIGYKRLFVKKIIQAFNFIRNKNIKPAYEEIK